jgi:alkylation response protein AidB-like acyl-CoA dehydrogenase
VHTPDTSSPPGAVEVNGDRNPDVILHLSVADGPAAITVLESTNPHSPVPSLDTTRDHISVQVDRRPASLSLHDPTRARDALALLATADTVGALAATVELVTGHLVERTAFGRPLASFQVLQHRLADLEMLVSSARALVERAARALADDSPARARLVAAAHQHLATRAVAALDDCIQLSGGIGFTWEWPVHLSMRRAVGNARLAGRTSTARRTLVTARDVTVEEPEALRRYRERVRQVIAAHAPYVAREGHRAPTSPEQEAELRQWFHVMYDEGLVGADWPVRWGGRDDHEPIHELIVTEELIRARAPRTIDQVHLASHVLLRFGTDEQQQRHLPRIRTGDDVWCQLFSEPDAGSDLAGIRARATRRDDGSWVLGGQKTWTTDGHWAQFGLALLRTGAPDSRHRGITAFVVPMDAPGLVIHPRPTIGGALEFNDVFLDGVVLSPDALVGQVDGGWAVAMSGLEVERFGVGGNVVLLDLLLDDVLAVAGALLAAGCADRDLHGEIAPLVAEAEAAKAFVTSQVERTLQGTADDGDAPIAKVLYTEAYNRIASYGARLANEVRPLPAAVELAAQRLEDAWLWSRAITISGGSSEVMRNIIAKRRLDLPQGP